TWVAAGMRTLTILRPRQPAALEGAAVRWRFGALGGRGPGPCRRRPGRVCASPGWPAARLRSGSHASAPADCLGVGWSCQLSGVEVDAGEERVLGFAAGGDLIEDVVHEVGIAVSDGGVLDRLGGLFAGPDGLPGGPVAIQAGAGGGHPVA